jgi:predicted nuclease of predicted toxin-antitoxin system
MPKSLIMDQDSLDDDVSAALLRAAWDLVKTNRLGFERATDEEILTFASREGRVVYTANTRDFHRLNTEWLRAGKSHPGIIVRAKQGMPVGQQLRALYALDGAHYAEELINRVLFLERYLPT